MNQKLYDCFCKCLKVLSTSLVVLYLLITFDLYAISDTVKFILEENS